MYVLRGFCKVVRKQDHESRQLWVGKPYILLPYFYAMCPVSLGVKHEPLESCYTSSPVEGKGFVFREEWILSV